MSFLSDFLKDNREFSLNMDESDTPSCSLPSCSTPTPVVDYRIKCSNTESLRSILDITVKHVSELADRQNLKESSSQFVNQFTEVFKNALQENIIVNELPWVVDKNKLSTPEKEDHKQMVDDAVLNQLCKTVANVTHKRKLYPQQCCRVLDIKRKHKLQNLKKAKVTDSSPPLSLSPLKSLQDDKQQIKRFSDFCKDFRYFQETIDQQQKEREKLVQKINVASSIQVQRRTTLKSLSIDETVTVAPR